MFDPTIFDNLKVAFENQLYDLDNLDGTIRITGRTDRVEMSVMSREFAICFALAEEPDISAEIRLEATVADLSAEILELKGERPGCLLRICFGIEVSRTEAEQACVQIDQILQEIWPGVPLVQTLSRIYGRDRDSYRNEAELRFERKIDEDQMEDIPELISHSMRSLEELKSQLLS
ncbi:hypothetical protein GRF59_25720 [Paenibacillus sp. HJL G12]|uniref:Uncharacterized protein n=2 Tax=Paenibacillus dendrobii TaxID=2691084 RepID=A0A7X3LII3_9BACL|nr:hypothetical protein [Paenibacillus dendrobii]MWV47016.1 hypothetical protein [Paenibacillus dendrobii]